MANQPKKYKKFVATAATATLVASAIVPVASAASFTDVTDTNSHKDAISNLVDAGIIKGYPDGTFKPDQFVSRGQVVKLLGRWLETEGYEIPTDWNTKQRFNDLPVTTADKELVQYAALAKEAGAFNGANGNLNYSQNMARQQMAIVLVRAIKEIKDVDLVKEYKDAKFTSEISDLGGLNTEQREAITALEYAELTKAATLPGKAFKPYDTITRAQFASFLDRTMKMEVTAPAKAAVKAINSTTVEITFDQEVENVQALNFEIKDLEVKNAAVKQTNKKVVVLTTAPQTADKEYTVSLAGDEIGKFKGISAVNPTKVEMVSSATQGKLGQQVTVKAQVSVADGQSKAGIPVTFYVPGKNDAVYPTITGEAYTDENGVASYSYTRYAAGTDAVTAYATGDRSKFATGHVFWGVDTILSIEEVATGSSVNNGANKTYKVTYKNPTTGKAEANKTFNVGFVENMNVTSDKVANATVNGVKALQLSNGTLLDAAQITTDSKGEATFTVSGTNAAVTPVVYDLEPTTSNNVANTDRKKYDASVLQANAAKVTFGATQAEYKIEVTREGKEVAATGATNGREYKVIVKDKDGKVAKNEIVNVAFNENIDRIISTNTNARFVNTDGDTQVYYKANSDKQITVKTNDKGEATFVIGSDTPNDYATPVAWIDINSSNAKEATLDEGEPKAVAPISYFQAPFLDGSAIKSYKETNLSKAVTKFDATEKAVFSAELVNQSGKKMPGTSVKKVSYTIFNTGAEDIKIDGEIVSPNRSTTVTYPTSTHSSTDLIVESAEGKSTSVRVIATGVALNTDGKDYAFTAKEATATFTAKDEVPNNYIGSVESVNTADKKLTFVGKKPVSLKDAKFVTENNSEIADLDSFVEELQKYKNGVDVQYIKDSEGKVTFKIVRATISGGKEVVVDKFVTTLNSAIVTVAGETTSAATATVAATELTDKTANSLMVDGITFTYHKNALATDELIYADLEDLVYKINKNSKVKVKAAVKNGSLELTEDRDGKFSYTVNGVKLDSTEGKAGKNQEVTFTFSSALNVATGDKVVINDNMYTGTVASVNDGKKSVVVKFTGAGIPANTTINKFVIDGKASNVISYPTTPVVIK
ncbi:S-layer homology domain-containing protein [Lysinibacillus sp. Ag94]|uniref:S-layer homology domain-containing protein n=1 Tax=Lysinibacillus sp. Ag94 TaxID=2936682 RepID=UPI00200F7757|nr:S-layer homology domain-containing protein [Lysinibacillus sp. Ag94]UPW83700.1 S-layer homology domain-containing protein [Lysinibacillus sp. Ag94]